jgi:hypothetical protein
MSKKNYKSKGNSPKTQTKSPNNKIKKPSSKSGNRTEDKSQNMV